MGIEGASSDNAEFPADYLRQLQALQPAYLSHSDPIRQSGFAGGAERWRNERGLILEALEGDGAFLDVGCANGYLLACLCNWALERGIVLEPHGLDLGADLIELARQHNPHAAANFHCANAWDWQPPRQYDYVYALHDCAPPHLLGEFARRLLERCVLPGGRLIIGAYGSNSRQTAARDIAAALSRAGPEPQGSRELGSLPIVRIAWLDKAS